MTTVLSERQPFHRNLIVQDFPHISRGCTRTSVDTMQGLV